MSGSVVINSILEREGLKPGTFAKMVNVAPAQIYDLKSGKTKKVSNDMAKKILKVFPHYYLPWLLSGEGFALKEEVPTEMNTTETIKEAEPLNPNAILYVPLVNQYAYAGYLSGYQNNTYMETLPTIPFIADHEGRGNYIAFEVRGDSMNDGTEESYLEGDRLLCREIPQHLWVDSKLHIKKWDFVIVHEDGIIVKRITDHDVENHTITVHSLNDMYPDRILDLAEVKQIFNVIEMQRPRRR
jgi:plasmid maintenance system antidote protein VapI